MDTNISFSPSHIEKQTKAKDLTNHRSPSSSGNTQVTDKYQNRIQNHIGNCTGNDSHHRISSISLKAHLIIQHQRSNHKRSP